MSRLLAVVRRYLGGMFGLARRFRKARESGALTEGNAWDAFVRKLQEEEITGGDARTAQSEAARSYATAPDSSNAGPETGLRKDTQKPTTTHHDPYGPKTPRRILQALTGDEGGGLRTDAEKRRKHGRKIASGAELARWAEETGRTLEAERFLREAEEEEIGGGEHRVFYEEEAGRVSKLTKPGLFGVQAEDAGAYLQRWAWHNEIFGDDVQFEGIVTLPGEHAPRAVISQPFCKGRDATQAELADYLTERGFHQEGDRWVHPVRKLAVWDTITEGNAIMTAEGVRVIDLQIEPARPAELHAVSERSGVGRDTTFSLSASVVGAWVGRQKPITAPPGRPLFSGGETGLRKEAARVWAAMPASVQSRDGRTIFIKHPKQGTEADLLEHLTTSHNQTRTWVDVWRVFSLARIQGTLQNARYRFIGENGNHIYIQRYDDGRNHYVVVTPEGTIADQTTEDSVWTQWIVPGKDDRFVEVERIEMINPPK